MLQPNGPESYCQSRELVPGDDDEGDLRGDDKRQADKNREAARLWVSGLEAVQRKIGVTPPPFLGRFLLFSNYDEHGNPLAWPLTLLIGSKQSEFGEALDGDFVEDQPGRGHPPPRAMFLSREVLTPWLSSQRP